MLVLQECPICYADFDDKEMKPHTIPCGHIFCKSCLKELNPPRNICPICRGVFQSWGVRPVVGMLHHSQLDPEPRNELKEETILWESLKDLANASPQCRKVFASNHTAKVLCGSGISQETEIALGLLRALVSTEEEELHLKEKLEFIGDKAETLINRISLLEAELKELKAKDKPNPNLRTRPTPKLIPKPTIRDKGNETPRARVTNVSGSSQSLGGLTLEATHPPRGPQNRPGRGSRPPIELNPGRGEHRLQFDHRGPERGSRGNSGRTEATVISTTGRRACGACKHRPMSHGPTMRPTTS